MLIAVHTTLPVLVERLEPSAHAHLAAAVPHEDRFFTMSGAIVIVSPFAMFPTIVRQRSFPLIRVHGHHVIVERRVDDDAVANTGPRLTTSQHASPCEWLAGLGAYVHFAGAPGLVRSSA